MKIKLDENMPFRLSAYLRSLGHDADSVQEEKISGADDLTVWQHAQTEKRFLVTLDLDFSDVRRFRPGNHAGILLLRLATGNRALIVQRIQELFEGENVEKWSGCFVVATETRIRVIGLQRDKEESVHLG